MEFKRVADGTADLPTLELRVAHGETFTATGQDAKNLEANSEYERVDKPSSKSEKE